MTKGKEINSTNPIMQHVQIQNTSLGYIPDSWWGHAWKNNLESYANCQNNLSFDLTKLQSINIQAISLSNAYKGDILAYVQSSRQKPFEIVIRIKPLPKIRWKNIVGLCEDKIPDLTTLFAANFHPELKEVFTNKALGLFPAPSEIVTACSCSDWSDMCRHTLAVLYSIATKLDDNPALIFELRGVDAKDLLARYAGPDLESTIMSAQKSSTRILSDDCIEKLFKL